MDTTKETYDESLFCNLTKEEISNPFPLLKEFVEGVSLSEVRKLIVAMRDLCIKSDKVIYGGEKVRENVLAFTQEFIRFFEAAYIHINKGLQSAEAVLQTDCFAKEKCIGIHHVRVMERTYFKRSKSAFSIPCITLLGRWLVQAGFNPGDEIAIVSNPETLVITKSKKPDPSSGECEIRA